MSKREDCFCNAAREAREQAERLADILWALLNCTGNVHDPNRWHVLKGQGVRFSERVRQARRTLNAYESWKAK